MKKINVKELREHLDAGSEIQLVDVRESFELADGKLKTSIHIAMNDIPNNVDKLNPHTKIVFYCLSGSRSQLVVDWLARKGFDEAYNLTGGIHAWQLRYGREHIE